MLWECHACMLRGSGTDLANREVTEPLQALRIRGIRAWDDGYTRGDLSCAVAGQAGGDRVIHRPIRAPAWRSTNAETAILRSQARISGR